ncbi:MAG: PQQ-dependent sugar dehydrogenase [Chloroflexota bacterium]|nr:PQQ-dependent sugar dehydrogenase [Chloroflexota bacterium]
MTRVRVLIALLVTFVTAGAFLVPTIAQDAQPADFSPFSSPVALPGGTLPGDVSVQLVQVAGGLVDPINLTNASDGSGRLFVVQRTGQIRIVDQAGTLLEEPFLDIANLVKTDFLEQGLLGLAFHPQYEENGKFYVYYSHYSTNGDHFLAEYTVSADDPNVADPDSGRVLLTEEDPFTNHNGGTLHFGPDGYLYLSIGDGGAAGDPYDNAQDLSTILGKIIRIDVNVQGAEPYGIPADNPFAGTGEVLAVPGPLAQTGEYHPKARQEIWAYGLRNPWQFSFDRANGDLYIADVGQNRWEEVNYQAGGTPGGQNYGWDAVESAHCYPPAGFERPGTPVTENVETECDPRGVVPVAEYNHDDGSCSITGMGVHRAAESPALDGIYFNTDFCSGKVWGLVRDDAGTWVYEELLDTELLATGAGQDEAGSVYVTACNCAFGRDYDPYADPQGTVWRLVAADQVPEGAVTAPLAGGSEATPETAERPADTGETAGTPATDTGTPAADAGAPAAAASGAPAEAVTINAVDIAWDPNQMTIPANTDVTISIPNLGASLHTFVIPELGIDVEMASGQTGTVSINAPAGSYAFICDVPGHEAAGMVGTLTVE